jgi:hypothetical protein
MCVLARPSTSSSLNNVPNKTALSLSETQFMSSNNFPTTNDLLVNKVRVYLNCSYKGIIQILCLFIFVIQEPDRGIDILMVSKSRTVRHGTLGKTPLDEGSARRRDLYLTTHNKQTSMPPVGFELATPASDRLQTHALDRAVTRLGYSTRNRHNPRIFRDGTYGHFLVIDALRGKNREQISCRQKSHGPESCEFKAGLIVPSLNTIVS